MSNLLSVEFLQLIRRHMKPGGVEYYNTTWSGEAILTGATVFPNALRIGNFLAVSDSPIAFDTERLRSVLSTYRIDGRAVFDLTKPEDRSALERIVSLPSDPGRDDNGKLVPVMEERMSLLQRLKGMRLITDDNMGTEWR
jgi:hypothetical protein